MSDLAAGRAAFLLGMVLGALVPAAGRPLPVLTAAAAELAGGLVLLRRAGRQPAGPCA